MAQLQSSTLAPIGEVEQGAISLTASTFIVPNPAAEEPPDDVQFFPTAGLPQLRLRARAWYYEVKIVENEFYEVRETTKTQNERRNRT